MKVALGCDHRGYRAKERLKAYLQARGMEVMDFGANSPESSDYPDAAFPASQAVSRGDSERGILMCGTGIGMSISANKVRGIRASLCHDELSAELARRHNDANMLCIPCDLVNDSLLERVVDIWLSTPFDGGRHDRRIQKIAEYESHDHHEG